MPFFIASSRKTVVGPHGAVTREPDALCTVSAKVAYPAAADCLPLDNASGRSLILSPNSGGGVVRGTASTRLDAPGKRHGVTDNSPLAPRLVDGIDLQACLSFVGTQKKTFYEATVSEMQTAILGVIPPEMKATLQAHFPDVLKTCCGVLGALAAVYGGGARKPSLTAVDAKWGNVAERSMAGLHDEATLSEDTARRYLRKQRLSQTAGVAAVVSAAVEQQRRDRSTSLPLRRTSGGGGTAGDTGGTTVVSDGPLAASTSMRTSPSVQLSPWAPSQIAQRLMEQQDDRTPNNALTKTDSVAFRAFERAAEEYIAQQQFVLLQQVEPAEAAAVAATLPPPIGEDAPSMMEGVGGSTTSMPTEDGETLLETGEVDDRLLAMRQQLLQMRVGHTKGREVSARGLLVAAYANERRVILEEFMWFRRFELNVEEGRAWKALEAACTSASLAAAMAARRNRRHRLTAQAEALVAEQKAAVASETNVAIREAKQLETDAKHAALRIASGMQSTVEAATRADREDRLRALVRYRDANPVNYFPGYTEEFLESEGLSAFVPMRMATDKEFDEQLALLRTERHTRAAPEPK